jgi:hypothetical protein
MPEDTGGGSAFDAPPVPLPAPAPAAAAAVADLILECPPRWAKCGPTYTGKWITSSHKIDCPQIANIFGVFAICGQLISVTVTKIDCPQIANIC